MHDVMRAVKPCARDGTPHWQFTTGLLRGGKLRDRLPLT